MSGRLQGKIAIVTGSSSGLGRAIAHTYASEGASICCMDLHPTPQHTTNPKTGKPDDWDTRRRISATTTNMAGGPSGRASSFPASSGTGTNFGSDDSGKGDERGGRTGSSRDPDPDTEPTHKALQRIFGGDRAFFVKTDVTSAVSMATAIGHCVDTFGRLDIMVCNAGITVGDGEDDGLFHGIADTSEEDWDRMLAVNAKGVFLGCKYAIRQFLSQDMLPSEKSKGEGKGDRGWIVNTASVQGSGSYYGTPSYSAAKGAIAQLTKRIAVDYAKDRIYCNALCPGFLKTTKSTSTSTTKTQQNLQAEILDTQHAAAAAETATIKAHPLDDVSNAEDVSRTAVFLASEDARWVTGMPLPLVGGYAAF